MKNKLYLLLFLIGSTPLQAQVTWEARANFPGVARNHAIALSYGTNGYLLTGVHTANMKDFWEYNSITDTWKQLPDFPGGIRSYGVGFVINNKAYIGFGHQSTNVYLTDWWEYDFTATTWTKKNAFPGQGRDHPTCSISNGMIYMGFGDNHSGSINDWWQYNPSTDTWTSKTSYPGTPMHHPVSANYNELIYLTEGHLESSGINHGSKKTYSYNPSTDTWKTLTDMPGPGVVAGASFALGNKVYSGAGIEEPVNGYHYEFYEYDIASDTWAPIANYPGTGIFAPVYFVIGSDGYVVTGQDEYGYDTQDCYRLHSPLATNIMEHPAIMSLHYYPNPIVNSLTVEMDQADTPVFLYDPSGRKVGDWTKNKENLVIDMSRFPAGLYFLKAGTFMEKVMKE